MTIAGVTLAILGASILAAVMDQRVAQKNALLDTALNNMSHGVMMFDADSRVILCNQRYLDLYRLPAGAIKSGITLREVIERRIAAGTFDGDPDSYCATVLGAVARRQASTTDHRAARRAHHRGRRQAAADGGWVATHQDITEERRRQASFRFLFENNPLPMWVWDHETLRFLAVNKAAEEKYGYDRETFLRLTLRDIKRSPDWSSIESTVGGDESGLREGQTTVHAKADGSLFDVAFYGRSMNYEGRAASLITLIDITERKRAEDELRRTRTFLDTIVENMPADPHRQGRARQALCAGQPRGGALLRRAERGDGRQAGRRDLPEADRGTLSTTATARSPNPERCTPPRSNRSRRRTTACACSTPRSCWCAARTATRNTCSACPRTSPTASARATRSRTWRCTIRSPTCRTAPPSTRSSPRRSPPRRTANKTFAVLSIDLDRFKEVNDVFGHATGDALLCEAGRRLREAAGGAFLARFGGDEFALIVADGAATVRGGRRAAVAGDVGGYRGGRSKRACRA